MRGERSSQLIFVCVLNLINVCLGTDQLRIVEFKSFPNESHFGPGLKNVQLLCTVKGQADRLLTVTIERLLPARPPQTLVSKQPRSEQVKVFYDIATLTCEDMGVYRCQATMKDTHQPDYTNISLNFYGCPPSPCPGEGNSTTVYAAINETKTVYFCMQAFPELTSAIQVRRGSSKETRLRSGIEDYQLKWNYTFLPDLLSYYNVSVTVYDISQSNYTDLTLRLMTAQGTQYDTELAVSIRPFGPPDCPTDLQLTYVKRTHLLSWTPEMDGGFSQWFEVFYTSNGTWTQHQVSEGLTSLNITDLQDNVQYNLTVAAVNNFTNPRVYSENCSNNAILYTATRPPDCPTDLNMTSKERVHMLSWTPGSSGSSSQWFEVFYTSNNTQRHVTSSQTSVNLIDLHENTEYHVTVASTNNHTSKIVNETSCEDNTIIYRVPATGDNMIVFICLVVGGVVMVVVTVILVVCIKRVPCTRSKRQPVDEFTPSERQKMMTSPPQEPGAEELVCLNNEGLHYVSIAHLSNKGKKKKRKQHRPGAEERVDYATLDFDKTAQLRVNDKNCDNSTSGLTYVTIDHSRVKNKRNKRKPDKTTTEQSVDYATLDFNQTGQKTVNEIKRQGKIQRRRVDNRSGHVRPGVTDKHFTPLGKSGNH